MSIEQEVKEQFARVFYSKDWRLFKKIAESNLREAVKLQKANMQVEASLRLLARNARKRLLIGIGVELLLKAAYLKHGYMINKPADASALTFPFTRSDSQVTDLVADSTYGLNDLIQSFHKLTELQNRPLATKGLRIAKVFRNKEGHGVTPIHRFEASNYRDIEASLIELYRDVFSERLSVRFSFEPNEKGLWAVSTLD